MLLEKTQILTVRARTVAVSGDRAVPVQADVEIVARLPVTIDIAEQPLLLIRPPA